MPQENLENGSDDKTLPQETIEDGTEGISDNDYQLQQMESFGSIEKSRPKRDGLHSSKKIANSVAKKASKGRKEDLKSRKTLNFSPKAIAALNKQSTNLTKKRKHE